MFQGVLIGLAATVAAYLVTSAIAGLLSYWERSKPDPPPQPNIHPAIGEWMSSEVQRLVSERWPAEKVKPAKLAKQIEALREDLLIALNLELDRHLQQAIERRKQAWNPKREVEHELVATPTPRINMETPAGEYVISH